MASFITKKSGDFDLEGDGTKRDSDQSFRMHIFKQLDRIPGVQGNYKIEGSGYKEIPIDTADQKYFSKKGVNGGFFDKKDAASTGNGEVSLWWLLNCQDPKVLRQIRENASLTGLHCSVNQGGTEGADPDLQYKDTYLEIKSNKKNMFNSTSGLGRFGRFGDFIDLVSMITSADNFLNMKPVPEPKEKMTTSLDNLKYEDLKRASSAFCDLRTLVMSSKMKDEPVFKKMRNTFDLFDHICNKPGLNKEILKSCTTRGIGGEHIASHLFLFIATQILSEKPGFGNWMINIPSDSPTKLECVYIDRKKLTAEKFKTGNNFMIKAGGILMKFNAFFK